jgi:hypothetical protein
VTFFAQRFTRTTQTERQLRYAHRKTPQAPRRVSTLRKAHYKGGMQIHSSLLNVVLDEELLIRSLRNSRVEPFNKSPMCCPL